MEGTCVRHREYLCFQCCTYLDSNQNLETTSRRIPELYWLANPAELPSHIRVFGHTNRGGPSPCPRFTTVCSDFDNELPNQGPCQLYNFNVKSLSPTKFLHPSIISRCRSTYQVTTVSSAKSALTVRKKQTVFPSMKSEPKDSSY